MTDSVQLPVQLPCSYVQLPCSPLPCLPLGELHACTRAARSPHGIGSTGIGLWCFDLAISRSHISAVAGPAVTLESWKASVRCPAAWSRSNESAGLQGPADTKTAHGHHQRPLTSTSFALAMAPRQRLVSMTLRRKVLHGEACSSAAREARAPGPVCEHPHPHPG